MFFHSSALLILGIAIATGTPAQLTSGDLQQKLEKVLQQFQKQEAGIKEKVSKADPLKASVFFPLPAPAISPAREKIPAYPHHLPGTKPLPDQFLKRLNSRHDHV